MDKDVSHNDTSHWRRYRTEIPNIVLHIGLSPYELALYVHLKRTAGAVSGGVCRKNTRRLAEETGISSGKISTIKESLARPRELLQGKALIAVREEPNVFGGSPSHCISVVDIWAENLAYFKNRGEPACSSHEPEDSWGESGGSQGESGGSQGESGGSQGESGGSQGESAVSYGERDSALYESSGSCGESRGSCGESRGSCGEPAGSRGEPKKQLVRETTGTESTRTGNTGSRNFGAGRNGSGEGGAESTPHAPKVKVSQGEMIEAIYAAYPRQAGKRAGLQQIAAALGRIRQGEADTGGLDAGAWLLERTRCYAGSPAGNQGRYTPHPTTWFGQARYCDDSAEWNEVGGREVNGRDAEARSDARSGAGSGGQGAPVRYRTRAERDDESLAKLLEFEQRARDFLAGAEMLADTSHIVEGVAVVEGRSVSEGRAFEGLAFEGLAFEGHPFEGHPFEGHPFSEGRDVDRESIYGGHDVSSGHDASDERSASTGHKASSEHSVVEGEVVDERPHADCPYAEESGSLAAGGPGGAGRVGTGLSIATGCEGIDTDSYCRDSGGSGRAGGEVENGDVEGCGANADGANEHGANSGGAGALKCSDAEATKCEPIECGAGDVRSGSGSIIDGGDIDEHIGDGPHSNGTGRYGTGGDEASCDEASCDEASRERASGGAGGTRTVGKPAIGAETKGAGIIGSTADAATVIGSGAAHRKPVDAAVADGAHGFGVDAPHARRVQSRLARRLGLGGDGATLGRSVGAQRHSAALRTGAL